MSRQTSSRRAHRVAAPLETRTTDNPPDYRDAFEVPTDRTDTRTPEQWARAVFESAPRKSRWFLLLGWRGVLGLRLGPRPSSDHVLGWRIVETSPEAVRLELRSAVMTAPPDPARGKLDGRLDHPRVLHATPGTPTLGGGRPDPPADDSLPPRARCLLATAHDRLKTVRDSI